eukprot:TRINITY_DN2953_c0_g1_i10.p1 TRINITY_DN2953_c0_g1~~TRINITY_DN2953_c0_g1_i10.p1  ORF type:complete len:128 (+),score=38.78 TRINITY_DN2953_c0_g1_i10:62-445(+)
MAVRRARSVVLSLLFAAAALCFSAQLLAPAFLQGSAARSSDAAAPAALGVLASMAGSMPAEALPGPLAGADVCVNGGLKYIVYPLCDTIYLVSPVYNFPLVLGFFTVLITIINIILPETQPDEDLRV